MRQQSALVQVGFCCFLQLLDKWDLVIWHSMSNMRQMVGCICCFEAGTEEPPNFITFKKTTH